MLTQPLALWRKGGRMILISFDYQLDKKGRLEHMLCCDSQSRQDYMDFGGAGV
jgi:hypothetical protein